MAAPPSVGAKRGPPGAAALPNPPLPAAKIELHDDPVLAAVGGTRVAQDAYEFDDQTGAQQIGEGTYGRVYIGRDRATGERVALKKMRMETEREGFPITALREIKILSSIRHPNVVNLREIVRSQVDASSGYRGHVYMVFDYCEHDLTGYMARLRGSLSAPEVKCVALQLLKGLAHLHAGGVLHRDLKASNLLLSAGGRLQLADFGLAREHLEQGSGARLTNRVITLWYRPPELLLGADRYGPEVDAWSVGCILAELLGRKPIFPGANEPDQLGKIFSVLGFPREEDWPGVSQLEFYGSVRSEGLPRAGSGGLERWCRAHGVEDAHAVDLLSRLLSLDPARRLSAREAATHDYFYEAPRACYPHELPKVDDSHELGVKKRAAVAAADGVAGGQGRGG